MAWFSRLWVKICLLVIVLGLTVGVFAYSRLSYPPAGPRVSVTSQPLKFSMELEKDDFQYGKNITIKFRLENIGNETITIWRGQPPGWPNEYKETSYHNVHGDTRALEKEFHFGFQITHDNGTEIYDFREGILTYAYDFRIDPGGWMEQTIIWNYYSIEWTGIYNPFQLARGIYQIRGAVDYGLNSSPICTLETPSIAFVIE